MAIILGIDPGLNRAGWGVIESNSPNLRYIACGSIVTSQKDPLSQRLSNLYSGINEVLQNYNPDSAAIEDTFVNTNPLSSLKLGHARGTLMLAVTHAGIDISEYASTKVKKSIVGVGRADKNQVEMMVKTLLPKAQIPNADAADALAIAICHASYYRALV